MLKIAIYLIILFPFLWFGEINLLKTEFVSPQVERYDCHSPTIIELSDHGLLVVWFGGFGEGKCDYPDFTEKAGIWMSRYEEGRWSAPRLIVCHETERHWNPVLHRLSTGELILFYKVGDSPRDWRGAFKRSYDEGETWSLEEELPVGFLGPIKNKAVVASDGSLICGSSVEAGTLEDPFQSTACWIEIASPSLEKWEKFGPIEIPNQKFGALQPALYFGDDGSLHLLCRDRAHRVGGEGFIWHAISDDQGKTWSELINTGLPNPDSGIDTLKLGKDAVVLVYNPSHEDRWPLTLALSEDNGENWVPLLDIESERSEYPYALATQDGLIHIVYSYSKANEIQRRIKHAVLSQNAD